MAQAQFIGADCGREATKIAYGSSGLTFPSRVGFARERTLVENQDYLVEIDGTKWFVGELARESFSSRQMASGSKNNEDQRILFLTAVALAAASEHIVITTGLPVIQNTAQIKAEYTRLLCGRHTVRVNNRLPVQIAIDEVGIVPEGAGAYFNELLDESGKVSDQSRYLYENPVRIIDLGSRTINLVTILERARYLDRGSDTLGYGMMELDNAITAARRGGSADSEKEREQMAQRIIGDINRRWLDYEPLRDTVILAGGGALTLEKWLRKAFPLCIVPRDPVMANAEGFKKMGMMRWQAKIAK